MTQDAARVPPAEPTCTLEPHVPSAPGIQRRRVDGPACALGLGRRWNLSPTLGSNTAHGIDLEDPTDLG